MIKINYDGLRKH